jgi:hypothetical protein
METTDMQWRSRPILRLTGRPPDPAPERKSDTGSQAAILRRFFSVLEKLETSLKTIGRTGGREP